MSAASEAPIALTIGDPNGIGPEIAVKAAAECVHNAGPRIVLVGDESVIRNYHARHGRDFALVPFVVGARHDHAIAFHGVTALSGAKFNPGNVDPAAGRATVAYLEAALALAREGHIRAIVGCPHSETAVNAAGIPFSGYPSLLARLTGTPEDRVFLMLVGGGLRILHATLHERLQGALSRLTPELVEAAARICVSALKDIGILNPRIGIFGINPHAGEGGLFGDDDERITAPAVSRLQQAGLNVEGPVGADLMLGRSDLDAFVAMYHDQGHIPVKLVAGRKASALSVGAGVVFSSVGHGAAFDIAGRGEADPEAVLRTVQLLSERPVVTAAKPPGKAA
ncbi:PdxA family dehydrogenase [Pseudorhodoplanes sp.]|uniref:PdxA family dehydrogenase n=1 Tax=Pseudorhodoplanes sp. TaxID=1934341 RepID=UPI003D0EBC7F